MVQPDRHELVGESAAMDRVRRFARRAGRTSVPVLITGETGTGKTLLARIIHEQGHRRRAPFVSVNCAGVPDGLFESEFFGHRRGAFTGALDSRRGLIEAAHEGTLFLDEVADLPLGQQAKLLTVIEDRKVRRIGEERSVDVDVRVISATSVDVAAALADGRFRADLYHRVALLRCTLPPLRERPDDIVTMAETLVRQLARKHDHEHPDLSPGVRALLVAHAWPGNVRELAHVLEAALILSDGAPLELAHIEEVMEDFAGPAPTRVQTPGASHRGGGTEPERTPGPGLPGTPKAPPSPDVVAGWGDWDPRHPGAGGAPAPGGEPGQGGEPGAQGALPGQGPDGGSSHVGSPDAASPGSLSEREQIRISLDRHFGDRVLAARELGISRSTLRTRMLRYGLDPLG